MDTGNAQIPESCMHGFLLHGALHLLPFMAFVAARSGGYDSDCGGCILGDSVGPCFSHLQAVLVLMATVSVQVLGVQRSSHLRSSGLELCLSSDTQPPHCVRVLGQQIAAFPG